MVRSATQSVWYHPAAIGLTFTWGAPVSPPPAAFDLQIESSRHGVEAATRLGVLAA